MAEKRKRGNQPRPGTFWDSRADPRGYGIDPVKAAGLMFAAAKKAREDQENYEYWRQNAGLTSSGAVSTGGKPGVTASGAAETGLTLVGNQIVTTGGTGPKTTQGTGVTDAEANPTQPATGGAQTPQETQAQAAQQAKTLQGNGTNMTPEEVTAAQNIMATVNGENPLISFGKGALHWLSEVFNYEDTYGGTDPETGKPIPGDGGDVPLESAFDAGLMGMNWLYDRISQVGSFGTALLPGGIDNLSWDQANDISWGQAAVTDAAQRQNWLEENFGPVGGAAGMPINILAGGAIGGMFGTLSALGGNEMAPFAAEDFDITQEAQRKAAFEDSAAGKWMTGLTDAAIAVIADPLIVGGKALKITKVRYLDRLVKTEEDVARIGAELDDGASKIAQNMQTVDDAGTVRVKPAEYMTDAEIDELKLAPIAMFAQKVVQRQVDDVGREVMDEATGNAAKVMSLDDIYYHPVVKNAANRDALSAALYNARNYDEASAILKHAAGSSAGTKYLNQVRPDMLLEILNGEKALVTRAIQSNPAVLTKAAARWQERGDQILNLIKQADRVGMDDAVKAQLYGEYDRIFTTWELAKRGEMPPTGVGVTATKEEIDLLARAAQKRLESDRNFFLSLERARGGKSETWGALQGSTKGFSSDTAFGRFAERSRQARAAEKAVAESRRGSRSPWKLWDIEEFNALPDNISFGRRALAASAPARVWHWAGSERPSGLIFTSGIGAQESARELRAMLDSLEMYSGEAKSILAEGAKEPRLVGGAARKAELLRQYQNAMLKGDVAGQADARRLIDTLESQLVDDMADYYGISRDALQSQHYIQNGRLKQIAEEIREKGYWVDEDGSQNYAPYLESQLQSSTFMKNWRGIEDVLKSSDNTLSSATEFTTYNVGRLNAALQSVWRPMVLLRGGYMQRNVAEGVWRSAALQFSLRPVGNVFAQGAISSRNVAAKAAGRAVKARKAVTAAEQGLSLDKMPKRFQKWHAKQTQAAEMEMSRLMDTVDTALDPLLAKSAAIRAGRVTKIDTMIGEFTRVNKMLDPVKDAGQIARNNAEVQALTAQKQRLAGLTDDSLDPTGVQTILDNINYVEDTLLGTARANRNSLDDMLEATADYRKQTLANRRLYDGAPKDATDPETMDALFKGLALEDPFDPASQYAMIALANLSADATVRQALGMRSEVVASAWSYEQARHYTKISPGHKNYYPSVARVLNQWNESAVGRVIVEGRASGLTDEQIMENVAKRLFDDTDGADIRKALWEADELKFSPDDPGGRSLSITELRAKAQADADKIVAPLDDEIEILTMTMTQAGKHYRDAVDEFVKSGRKSEHRMVVPGPNGPVTRRFRSRAAMDAYMDKQLKKLQKKEAERDVKWKEAAEVQQEKNRINLSTVDDATEYASRMLERYDQLTAGSVPLQRWLAVNKLEMKGGDTSEAGRIIEGFLGAKDANGKSIYELAPVLGDDVLRVGPKNAGAAARGLTDRAFHYIGAVPEDTFVRAPFYGQRYRDTAKRAYDILEKEVGASNITIDDVNAIRELAHRRALKDTKDWLYTIDRRTRFGDVMENFIPFSQATQNSVTAIGRLIWNDPAILGVMRLIWQSPDDLNDPTDPDNPDAFAFPIGALPDELKTLLGTDDYLRFNKKSFDLITQGTFDFTAGPLIAISSSELMKNQFFGLYTSGTPDWFKAALPDEVADALWQGWKDHVYGEGFGVSESMASVDMLLAPHVKRLVDVAKLFFGKEGSSAQMADIIQSSYALQKLEFVQGKRPDPPSYEEARKLALGTAILRWGITVSAFTTPKYVSDIDKIARVVQEADSAYKADQELPEDQRLGVPPPWVTFGDAIMWVADSAGTRSRVNNAGMPASFGAERFVREHSDLMRDVASQAVETGDLSLLAMFVPNVADHYAFDDPTMNDPSVRAIQMSQAIPGANGEMMRAVADPAYQQARANVESGWDVYIRGKQAIEAVMNQRGIWSWTSAAARPYKQKKDELIASIAADKRYVGWYDEFEAQQGGTRTRQAIIAIQKGLGNQGFREAMRDDPIWGAGGAAEQYVANWNAVTAEMERLGISDLASRKGGDYRGNLDGLAQVWENSRTSIARTYPDWAIFESRFLGDSPNPFPVGTYVEQFDVQTSEPMMAPEVFPAVPPQPEYAGGY